MRFKEQENSVVFEYIPRYNSKQVVSFTQEFELVEFLKQPAGLHCGLTKRVALKLAFPVWQRKWCMHDRQLGMRC
jgi:hypothetical protein